MGNISIEDFKKGKLANITLTPPIATLNTTKSSVNIEGKLIKGPTNNLFAPPTDHGRMHGTTVTYEFRGDHYVEYCSFRVYVEIGKFPFSKF